MTPDATITPGGARGDGGLHACDPCLRRALLIAMLAPRIAGLLDRPSAGRVGGLLALPEPELLAAVGGERVDYLREALDARDLDLDRQRFDDAGVAAICRHSAAYPPPLGDLADAPAVLFVLGRI